MRSGIGGIMIWELGQDVQPFTRPESLMNGILAALRPAEQEQRQEAGEGGLGAAGDAVLEDGTHKDTEKEEL